MRLNNLIILTILFFQLADYSFAWTTHKIEAGADSTKYINQAEGVNDSLIINKNGLNEKTWNEVCSVLGFKVDPESETILFDGKLYGFCCKDCPRKFEANPEGYSLNLSEDGKNFIGKKGLPKKEKQQFHKIKTLG